MQTLLELRMYDTNEEERYTLIVRQLCVRHEDCSNQLEYSKYGSFSIFTRTITYAVSTSTYEYDYKCEWQCESCLNITRKARITRNLYEHYSVQARMSLESTRMTKTEYDNSTIR